MEFKETIKQAIKTSVELREAFILEQITPYFEWDEKTEIATITDSLKLRMSEIKDYKQRVKEAIDKYRGNFESGCWDWWEKDKRGGLIKVEELLTELGLE